jgi:hypothetical protein
VECGKPTKYYTAATPAPVEPKAFLGGTVKLPSAGALPPGLWWQEQPPGAHDTVQIYMPLRAVVGGWSGQEGHGWYRLADPPALEPGKRRFHFACDREWFPAQGFGGGLRLRVKVQAESDASDGRRRQGFRYHIGHDPPMEVIAAHWVDAHGKPVDRPLPEIQLMAPPRIMRVSDYRNEEFLRLPREQAEAWASEGVYTQPLQMINSNQSQTPVGRGIVLSPPPGPNLYERLFAWADYEARVREYVFRVQIHKPLQISWHAWLELRPRIEEEARSSGLDLGTAAMVEWWFERQGYDSAIITPYPNINHTGVVAFRRAQICMLLGK